MMTRGKGNMKKCFILVPLILAVVVAGEIWGTRSASAAAKPKKLRMVMPEDEITLITAGGIALRTAVENVRMAGRPTLGVRVISLDDGDRLASLARLEANPEENARAAAEAAVNVGAAEVEEEVEAEAEEDEEVDENDDAQEIDEIDAGEEVTA